MAKKKAGAHGGGGHGWFVTFADLMGLLVAFFVMLVAFSNTDQKKLQIVAGSMREAFGTQTAVRYSGIIEIDGLPTRPRLKNADNIKPEESSATPTPDDKARNSNHGARSENDGAFALASASLRQAMQEMPEIAGRADTQPLFPDDPFVAANRRVTITLMREAPAMPANLKP